MIRVIVVDDQQVMREGLAALLGLVEDVEVLGTAGDGHQALALLAANTVKPAHDADNGDFPDDAHPVDVVLMDLRMPVMDGVEATGRIVSEYPGIAVVVLTTYTDDESIARALRAGARGYLTKDAGRAEIAAALRSAVTGQSTFDAKVSDRLVAAMDRAPRPMARQLPGGLTAREAEVLGLIADGLSNAEIAAALFIGEATVKTHINNVFAKIGVRNRVEATHYAGRHGLGG
ncbi:response regulator transcription factor [Nonomuraea sp. NEAU-A123]|nr:response regulator transcription factor [Nonomuraea sp. NEAU-A123]